MKQLEVQIMGLSYLLSCPDGGDDHLLYAVTQVDAAMCKIRESGKVRARDRIAVLAAVNLVFDLTKHAARQPAPQPDGLVEQGAASPQLTSLLARLDVALNCDNQLL